MTRDCDWLVIGSGPGGAMTASTLAAAGHSVLVAEEGPALPVGSAEPYSLAEMDQKWRNGGLTPAFGPVKVTYVEARCVGGASEVNAALYHPPIPELLDTWAARYGIDGFGAAALAPHVDAVERLLGVSAFPGSPGIASERLREGAERLGWKSTQVKRFWRYPPGEPGGRRQSMSETLLPAATRSGARVESGLRIRRLRLEGRRVVGAVALAEGRAVDIRCQRVVLCAGAVQTALILRRSGLSVGDTLTMNPMIRLAASFPDKVNEPELGVPVEQIEQFKPDMTLGCSHSSLAHLALWLVGDPQERDRRLAEWQRLGVFYAKVMARARGRVRNVPVFDEAFVRYAVGPEDLELLGLAAERLGRVLFAAGAEDLVSPVPGDAPIRGVDDLPRLRAGVQAGKVQLTAIHLHSTVPLSRGGPVDPWGQLHAWENAWVNDASLLPDTPGINPQGLILAVARRNAERLARG